MDPATGTQSIVSSGSMFIRPMGLAVEASGTLLVADPFAVGDFGAVIRVDPATGEQFEFSLGEGSDTELPLRPMALAVDADGSILVLEQTGGGVGGRVVRADAATGTRTLVSSGGDFVSPTAVAVEADGSILVADANAFGGGGGVIRINSATGEQTTVSSGGDFVGPLGIAVEADGTILIGDVDAFGGDGGLIRVDPATGAQTRLSSGGSFRRPGRIAILPATKR
ncbi:MAG: hypothetical protein ACRDSG_08905 [Pseudonocardiaceae bacterium]